MIQNKKYSIEGMNCGSCAVSVEMLLDNQQGVKTAKVNFENKDVMIEFEDQEFNLENTKKLIQQMGYKLTEKYI